MKNASYFPNDDTLIRTEVKFLSLGFEYATWLTFPNFQKVG